MNPGEIIQLTIPIHYDGTNNFNNMYGTITSDNNMNIIFNEVYYGNISNGTNNPDQAFIFELSELIEHNEIINFYVTLDNGQSQYITNLSYNIESFELNVVDMQLSIDDNGNNLLDPGESANATLQI